MRIYFSGIGGVGIGPLAMIAHDAGYDITGSDREQSLTTDELDAHGILYSLDQSGDFLQSFHDKGAVDYFVYTAALSPTHPELVLAKKLGIACVKRDTLISKIIHDKNLQLIAVAGTHGKTTTTGMLAWIAHQCDIPVSYAVGSGISFGPSGKFHPDSTYFIYECDEFDRNFLHFYPHLSVIVSYDYDHPDTYPTPQDYQEAFKTFISQSRHTICSETVCNAIFSQDVPQNVSIASKPSRKLNVPGLHMRQNTQLALEVSKASFAKDRAEQEVITALNDFPGTARRFEKLASNLYSDYGHHPAEIAATLQMAREINQDITLVYQPHQNRRQHEIKDEYRDQFEHASRVFWLPTYLTREDDSLDILSSEELTQQITNRDKITYAQLDDELFNAIQTARNSGSLVLCMGAGTIDGWIRGKITKK